MRFTALTCCSTELTKGHTVGVVGQSLDFVSNATLILL